LKGGEVHVLRVFEMASLTDSENVWSPKYAKLEAPPKVCLTTLPKAEQITAEALEPPQRVIFFYRSWSQRQGILYT